MSGPLIAPAQMNSDAFYAARDNRTQLEQDLGILGPQRIAIVVPSNVSSHIGVELALFWAASIIRRMGRSFAEVILVSSSEFRQSEARTANTPGVSVERWITDELRSADPFG